MQMGQIRQIRRITAIVGIGVLATNIAYAQGECNYLRCGEQSCHMSHE